VFTSPKRIDENPKIDRYQVPKNKSEFGTEPGQFSTPTNFNFDPDGNFIVSEFLGHRLQDLTWDGQLIREHGSGIFQEPHSLAFDSGEFSTPLRAQSSCQPPPNPRYPPCTQYPHGVELAQLSRTSYMTNSNRRQNNTLTVGDVHITGLTDGSVTFDPRQLFPETPLETWEPFYDRFPEYFSGQHFKNNLGSFVFTSGDQRVIADTGFGPHGEMLGHPAPGELMNDLAKNGIDPDSINTVFLTHLHGDHVGWNLREDRRDRPVTFPNAKYRVHEADWNHFTSPELLDHPLRGKPTRRSVIPLDEMGLLELMDGETELAPGVTAFPTPGHTPGHMSLLIASQNERAILVGDILGSPMQATATDYLYTPDWDTQMGVNARNSILDKAENEKAVVIGSHLSYPGWGTMIRWEGKRYWNAL